MRSTLITPLYEVLKAAHPRIYGSHRLEASLGLSRQLECYSLRSKKQDLEHPKGLSSLVKAGA